MKFHQKTGPWFRANLEFPFFEHHLKEKADPAHPAPLVGYITLRMAQEYMVSGQRFAAARPDVLTFVSEVLEEDLVMAGPLEPQLFLETTGPDADYVVKVIDVYPDDDPEMGGYQQQLRGEPFRAKFRESLEKPKAIDPGKRFEVKFTMPGICHNFRRGHRVMVQIQSSWFPLVDLNLQKFGDIPNMKANEFQKATHKLFHEAGRAIGVGFVQQPAQP